MAFLVIEVMAEYTTKGCILTSNNACSKCLGSPLVFPSIESFKSVPFSKQRLKSNKNITSVSRQLLTPHFGILGIIRFVSRIFSPLLEN